MALTNLWLKANLLKNVNKPYMKADRDGLSVRVSKNGTLTFTMRYRFNGKADQMALGTYPLMSLADAREKNSYYRTALLEGINPKNKKVEDKRVNIDALTFDQLFEQWYNHEIVGYCSEQVTKQAKVYFEKHVFNKLGNRFAKDINIVEWLEVIEGIQKNTPTVAAKILGYTKKAYNFGVMRQLVEKNPVAIISATKDLRVEIIIRERYLSNNELKLVLKALDEGCMNRRYELFTILCLFFGCRPSELRKAEKSHFDFDNMIWTVPKENHKNGKKTKKDLIRPLIPEILPLLKELFTYSPNDLVICTAISTGRSKTKVGSELNHSFFHHFSRLINTQVKKSFDVDMEKWSFYDLRKTMRTNLACIGEETKERIAPYHVCELMLGHKPPAVQAAYDKHNYLEQQRDAYSAWWARMNRIKADSDNVKTVKFG